MPKKTLLVYVDPGYLFPVIQDHSMMQSKKQLEGLTGWLTSEAWFWPEVNCCCRHTGLGLRAHAKVPLECSIWSARRKTLTSPRCHEAVQCTLWSHQENLHPAASWHAVTWNAAQLWARSSAWCLFKSWVAEVAWKALSFLSVSMLLHQGKSRAQDNIHTTKGVHVT